MREIRSRYLWYSNYSSGVVQSKSQTSPLGSCRISGQPWYSVYNHSQETKALDIPSQNDYTGPNQEMSFQAQLLTEMKAIRYNRKFFPISKLHPAVTVKKENVR